METQQVGSEELSMRRFGFLGILIPGLLLTPLWSAEPAVPKTVKKPVTESYHGVNVVDNYRWLENGSDPAVRKWVKDQNQYTRTVLDKYPALKPIRKRLVELVDKAPPHYEQLTYQRKLLFALKDGVLVTRRGTGKMDTEQVVVDPDKVIPDQDATIDYYTPSPDNRLVAVSLSTKGKENGTAYIFEVATGKKQTDQIPRVITAAGGGLTWKGDGSGLFYSRHLSGNKRPQANGPVIRQIFFHKLGTTSETDTYCLGKDFPANAGIGLDTSRDARYVVASVSQGSDNNLALYVLGPTNRWIQVSRFADRITGAEFGPDNSLYLFSLNKAPRGQVLRMSLVKPDLAAATTVVPEGKGVIQGVATAASRLYVLDLLDGSERIRVLDLEGKQLKTVPLKPLSSVKQVVPLEKDEVLFENETYLDPPAWYRYDPATGKTVPTALSEQYPAHFSDTEVVREFAVSRDGTRIPMHILRRKGIKLDSRNPTLLTGYGGFGENELPSFDVTRRIWLEQGGVYAVAHPRGDGEYGEDWHLAARRTRKQTTFDDFTACMRHLVDRKYTNRDRLAISGASNGGLLVGAMVTQQPDRFRAAVANVGAYDMLRLEVHATGAMFTPEFGTVKDPDQFKALYAYSPYQRVTDGKAYPAVFLQAGENDNRVDPAHTWKMAARLQSATSSKTPILLWTSLGAGHESGPGEATLKADEFAFLFFQLGVRYRPVASPAKVASPRR
jgi:prolyl oligopeptidase